MPADQDASKGYDPTAEVTTTATAYETDILKAVLESIADDDVL